VNRILEAFKKGKRDSAEFWIKLNERLIYIRYFAVRDREGQYLGTLEVTQDITKIKKIKGEKRILDWK
ncbi:PAS domain-containing protein, partial [Candidatus Bathyarchaeota archaeon]|nr:PAS domain-containing protein [Candidatus Bathyarchaeota archaeon]